jgi:hypothetical protein
MQASRTIDCPQLSVGGAAPEQLDVVVVEADVEHRDAIPT